MLELLFPGNKPRKSGKKYPVLYRYIQAESWLVHYAVKNAIFKIFEACVHF